MEVRIKFLYFFLAVLSTFENEAIYSAPSLITLFLWSPNPIYEDKKSQNVVTTDNKVFLLTSIQCNRFFVVKLSVCSVYREVSFNKTEMIALKHHRMSSLLTLFVIVLIRMS